MNQFRISVQEDGMILVDRYAIANALRALLLTRETDDFHLGAIALAATVGVVVTRQHSPDVCLPPSWLAEVK
jgi:hypothetical protein